jgi:rRNA processing protein Gar1
VYLLGQVKGLGYDGKLIICGKFAPKLKLEVLDSKKKMVGTVNRVFGPVSSPYISVKPPRGERPQIDIIGNPVYVNKNHRIKIWSE